MTNTEATPAAQAPTQVAKVKKTLIAKKPSSHPPYQQMITEAISSLKEKKGSSRQAILKYIVKNYKINAENVSGGQMKLALKRAVVSGVLKQSKGTGASGSFKLADKKTSEKKPTAKEPVKKAAVKKAKSPKKKVVKPKSPAKKAKKTKVAKPAKKVAKSPKKVATKPAKNVAKSPKKVATKPAKKVAKSPKKVAKKPAAKKAVKAKTPKAAKKAKK